MADFHGVFPYLVSPVDPSGQIRTEVLGRLCDDLIKAGVHGLTPLGSTGEFAYLGQAQRTSVVQTTIEAAKGRVPVIAGVASTSMAGPAGTIPRRSCELTTLGKAGRGGEAMVLQPKLWRTNEAFAPFTLAPCIKAGLDTQGYGVGAPAPPQAALTADQRKVVERA